MSTIYKIRDRITGAYSKGGARPYWTLKGKVWKQKSHVSLHFVNILEYSSYTSVYDDAEVVEFELVEKSVTPVGEWIKAAKGRSQVRKQASRARREARLKEIRRQQWEGMKEEFGE